MLIKKIFLIISLIFYNVICSFAQDSQSLPAGNEGYNVETKFKLKENLMNKFWQDRDANDWKQELKYWKFGYLPEDDNSTPIAFIEENSLARKENNYFRIFNGAKVSILNPLACGIQANLSFFVDLRRKNAKLSIGLNGAFIKDVILPSSNNSTIHYSRINIDNIDLQPGKNELIFYDSQDCFHKKVSPRDLFINIRDDFRSEVISTKPASKIVSKNQYSQAVDEGSLNILISQPESQDEELVILSRDLDINLEEYPYLALDYKLDNMPARVGVFLGVGFNDDSIIDAYINLLGNEEANLLELAVAKWLHRGEYKGAPKFYLKKIIIVFWDRGGTQLRSLDKNKYFSLKLNNLLSYSKKSRIIPVASYPVGDIKIAKTNCIDYYSFLKSNSTDDQILETRVFHHKLKFKDPEENIFSYREYGKQNNLLLGNYFDKLHDHIVGREEYVDLNLPVNFRKGDQYKNLYFSFWYSPQNSLLEDLDVILDFGNNKVSVQGLSITKDQTLSSILEMRDGFCKIEVSLGRFGQADLTKLKNIIFRYRRNANFSGSGWKVFKMKGPIKFYLKYPAVINGNNLNQELLEHAEAADFAMLNIDGKDIKRFKSANDYPGIHKNQIVNLGHLRLGKGEHELNFSDNDLFYNEWVRFSPASLNRLRKTKGDYPAIYFKKVNQTKYLVRVIGAKSKFWLTFQQLFHPLWRIYLADDSEKQSFELIEEYKEMNANECKPALRNDSFELKYLFKPPVLADHLNVNLYANAWFINPQRFGGGEDFVLVVYFWPQAFCNLGVIISFTTLIMLLSYFLFKFLRFKHGK